MVLCKVMKTPVVFITRVVFYRGELRKKKEEKGKRKGEKKNEQRTTEK